jgi:hypothetical protein
VRRVVLDGSGILRENSNRTAESRVVGETRTKEDVSNGDGGIFGMVTNLWSCRHP